MTRPTPEAVAEAVNARVWLASYSATEGAIFSGIMGAAECDAVGAIRAAMAISHEADLWVVPAAAALATIGVGMDMKRSAPPPA